MTEKGQNSQVWYPRMAKTVRFGTRERPKRPGLVPENGQNGQVLVPENGQNSQVWYPRMAETARFDTREWPKQPN